MYLSKSDFILGCSCEKALWLKKHRRDLLEAPETNAQADTGYEVQDLAHQLFPEAVEITAFNKVKYTNQIEVVYGK